MLNPWLSLSRLPPYVLPCDAEALEKFNSQAEPDYRYDLSLFPEPYFGSAQAQVVLLNLNPGWHVEDRATHADPTFAERSRRNLERTLAPYPFLHLQPTEETTPGARWWRQRTRVLAEDVGFDAVAKGISCIQNVAYHSVRYSQNTPSLPSQSYTVHLVRDAMKRGAEIIVMRSWELWTHTVPELTSYKLRHRANNPRSPYLSPKNLGAAYLAIAARLRAGV